MKTQNINPMPNNKQAKIPTTGALFVNPRAFALRKYGPTILPTCPNNATRGNPRFAESGDVISVTIAQNNATINEPKLSTQIYHTQPRIRNGLFTVFASPIDGSEKHRNIIN